MNFASTLVRVGGPQYRVADGQMKYGIQLGMDIIDGMSEYYGYNYSDSFGPHGSKSDQIGINQFSAGAMENWGLVTYQEYLVYIKRDSNSAYESSLVSTAQVFAHELQHQWTGNLITCTWWDEIWINEGFADYGGYLGLQWAEPLWNWESEFVKAEFFTGLRADHAITSRPIINKQNNNGFKVDSPASLGAQFDMIAYAKSGSVLRMTIHVMTETRWQYGMRIYLNERKFTNTDGEIYFSYMQRTIEEVPAPDKKWDIPYSEYVNGVSPWNQTYDCWFRQMGYPVVHVRQRDNEIVLTQSRYLHSGPSEVLDQPESSLGYRWNIPVSYINQNNDWKLDWMLTTDQETRIEGTVGKDLWLDPEAHTFMRIHYGNAASFRTVSHCYIKTKTNVFVRLSMVYLADPQVAYLQTSTILYHVLLWTSLNSRLHR